MQSKLEAGRLGKALRGQVERLQSRAGLAVERGCQLAGAQAKRRAADGAGALDISHRVQAQGPDAVGQVVLAAPNAAQLEFGYRSGAGGVPGRYILTGALEQTRGGVVQAVAEALRKGE